MSIARPAPLRRSWNGLEAALFATPAGATRAPASLDLRLGIHVGRPVRATCRFDGRTHRRLQSRGDIDLVPAGLPGVWEDDRPTKILRVTVSSALLRSAAIGLDLDPDRIELVPQFQLRDPQLEHLAWAFEAELTAGGSGDCLYGESLAMALAAHLVRRYRTSPTAPVEAGKALSRRQLARVTEHVEEHLDQRLSLAELAGIAGVSVTHFKALFKGSTGLPVHQYVVRRRVERARILLLEGASSISSVALQTGFSDPSHLARWMRRILGVTPAAVQRGDR